MVIFLQKFYVLHSKKKISVIIKHKSRKKKISNWNFKTMLFCWYQFCFILLYINLNFDHFVKNIYQITWFTSWIFVQKLFRFSLISRQKFDGLQNNSIFYGNFNPGAKLKGKEISSLWKAKTDIAIKND